MIKGIALVRIAIKGMWAVQLYSDKILFLAGGGSNKLSYIVAIKLLLLSIYYRFL